MLETLIRHHEIDFDQSYSGICTMNEDCMYIYIYIETERILHGKCARTVFIHESFHNIKLTRSLRSLVRFMLRNDE